MHLLVRESADLDETAQAEDLGLAPADVVMLSFSDSDLLMAAAAWRVWGTDRPSVRLANLARLRHPMSVDLFAGRTLPGSKAVLVRLLGGLDYWRYGCEELARCCRALGVALAVVAGDGRPDARLTSYATVDEDDLAAFESLLDAGGALNARSVIAGLIGRARGEREPVAAPVATPPFGVYRISEPVENVRSGSAAIIFYRSFALAGDAAPIDELLEALAQRGISASALYVPSLKNLGAAAWLREELARMAPDVILNATAFSASDGQAGSPLDGANCPVLQIIMPSMTQNAWRASSRGLGAADLAMHVALPEVDGRITGGVISFKHAADFDPGLGFSPVLHRPHDDGVAHAADLAAAWARLRKTRPEERKVALVLSTYPGRPDQIAHAVGLDGPQSASAILRRLAEGGYTIANRPETGRDLLALLTDGHDVRWPVSSYVSAFSSLPHKFQASVIASWGAPETDPSIENGAFPFGARQCGNIVLALQPERGAAADRKAAYHDPATPPCHAYVAFYLWLRRAARIDALIHLGAHGTLEWLPGKAVALSGACAPLSVLGPVPVIYPFIVNDPGEAAQAKRRIGAITLGHRTPPLVATELDDKLRELEHLVDEFSSAEGLDPKRRLTLARAITDAVERAGLGAVCGLAQELEDREKLARIDAFLCDVKELTIRDGLHVLDSIEIDAIVRALDGRFIAPGPSGAPSRGRADVLPTGRNLFSIDPRGVPTPTAMANGARAAKAIQDRYAEDHGEWPRAILLDLWGSATLRTGGEELAAALALLGVKPKWDSRSFRVSGFEIIPAPLLDRPRVDVTLRISGLFRDMFAMQLTLFDAAVQRVAALTEDRDMNPLAAASRAAGHHDRIFGPAAGNYGTGVMARIDRSDWSDRGELGAAYLANSGTAYRADGAAHNAERAFSERVRASDAFVHLQDHRETDLLTGGDFAAHEGGFAAAAASLGNASAALYHGDTGEPERPRIRTLDEECARVVAGRAASPRWIEGQMRHGFRGAAELAATVDAAFAFAATAGAVTSGAFESLYDAYLGDANVAAFIRRENPAALAAMGARFNEAIARGLWRPRRNDLSATAPGEGLEAER